LRWRFRHHSGQRSPCKANGGRRRFLFRGPREGIQTLQRPRNAGAGPRSAGNCHISEIFGHGKLPATPGWKTRNCFVEAVAALRRQNCAPRVEQGLRGRRGTLETDPQAILQVSSQATLFFGGVQVDQEILTRLTTALAPRYKNELSDGPGPGRRIRIRAGPGPRRSPTEFSRRGPISRTRRFRYQMHMFYSVFAKAFVPVFARANVILRKTKDVARRIWIGLETGDRPRSGGEISSQPASTRQFHWGGGSTPPIFFLPPPHLLIFPSFPPRQNRGTSSDLNGAEDTSSASKRIGPNWPSSRIRGVTSPPHHARMRCVRPRFFKLSKKHFNRLSKWAFRTLTSPSAEAIHRIQPF